MPNKNNDPNQPHPLSDNELKINLPGYPIYPAEEDIYSQSQEEEDIDPEDITSRKVPNENDELNDAGDDLDVPGADLDDAQEDIGNEDEENNFYSLGGDNHNDLEEDQGDD